MYIYLHGFTSSPRSIKAEYMADRFAELQIPLFIPDLNQDDFTHLTLTRQIDQVAQLFPPTPETVTLIGSSLGGLTAAWLGCQNVDRFPMAQQVDRLVLLAPAFGFLSHWLPQLGETQLQQWEKDGLLPVYHYGEQRDLLLNYQFILDCQKYQENLLTREIPTLILHGTADEDIPITSSREFAASRSWVTLIELDSDHGLVNVLPEIWSQIVDFCGLVKN